MKRGQERPARPPLPARPGRSAPRSAPPRSPAPRVAPLPLRHPAWLLAGTIAAIAVAVSVSFVLYEKDFWQHLAVGRAIARLHAVPNTQIWTWPTYGETSLTPSWGFRALIWPVWRAGGVVGLFVWRWATTLAVFALAFATARRLGARGMTPLVVLVICALTYRQRSQIRPETLAAVWLALVVLVLEWRRTSWSTERLRAAGAWRDPALLLVPLSWVWINTHLSYPLGFVVLVAYALDSILARRPGSDALLRAGALALAVTFLNPGGALGVLEPFRFFATQRGEPIFRVVPELLPLDLRLNLRNLLPLILFGWPALIAWRAARRSLDGAEVVLALVFIPLAFVTQRFLGFTMVVAAPFAARGLDAWVSERRWPRWTAPAGARLALVAGACVAAGWAEWRRPDLPLGIGLKLTEYPIVACDFMAREGVRGRGFNHFFLGGYMLYRFWPERDRLPFMDIHQTGTRADRDLYAFAMADREAWRELDRRHRFDYVLLRRVAYPGDFLVEHLDADSLFALVFLDDAAALWVRKDGRLAPLARRFAYRELPAGTSRLSLLGFVSTTDPVRRARIVAELEREAASSPYHSQALGRLGSLELVLGDLTKAERHLRDALATDPRAARAHERLGRIALALGRPRDALAEFDTERRLNGAFPAEELLRGRAFQALRDHRRARDHYRRQLALDPGNAEARDSLAASGDEGR